MIHYIRSGAGIYEVDGRSYRLHKTQGFLICPGVITYYQADASEPWSYSWVGFHGLKAKLYLDQINLTRDNPIFTYDRDNALDFCLAQMVEAQKIQKGREIRLLGFLYLFLSHLTEASHYTPKQAGDRKEYYVVKAMEFIAKNYSRDIAVADISNYLGLDRSYFCAVFKAYLNISPQQYLIRYRMDKACELMRGTSLSVGAIARSVGYKDPLELSKMFKKIKGASPREYRKKSSAPPRDGDE